MLKKILVVFMNDTTFYMYTGFSGILYSLYAASRYYSLSGIRLISSESAKEKIKRGIITQIIDVRSDLEWKIGHYSLADHIPVTTISLKTLQNNNIFFNDGILVYCNTGQRARYASEIIAKLGYKKVYYIDGKYSSLV